MAEKIISGDSLQNEFVAKFNGMVDEVNELKESGGSVELTKEAITDALGYTPSEEVRVTPKYTNGRNLAFIGIGNTGYNIYSPDAECITDVVELPDKEYMIDTSKIYRVAKVQSLVGGVKNQMPNPSTWLPDMLSGIPINIRHVETLPTAAVEPAYDNLDKPTRFVFYYLVTGEKLTDWSTDERIYAFLPAGTHLNTSTTYDVDTWVPVSAFLAHYMITDKGVITSESEATSSSHSSMYFLADIELYHYRNGWQKVSKGVTEEKVSEMIEEAVADIPSGGGGSTVSVTQTLTSGTKIGAITVDGKTTALYAPEGGSSGGGGGSIPADAIIDVDVLPTENINEKSFYRVPSLDDVEVGLFAGGVYVPNGSTMNGMLLNIIVVDILPEVGTVFQSATGLTAYVSMADGGVFGYDENYGWLNLLEEEVLAGIIFSPQDAADSEGTYLLITPKFKLYHYINGWHEIGGSSGGKGVSKSFIFDRTVAGEESSEDIGDYRYVTLSGENKTTCMELHNYVKENYHKIISIEYRGRLPISGVITQASYITHLNTSEDENSQIVVNDNLGTIEDHMNVRFGLRHDGTLIYPKDDNVWGFLLLLMFDITVTTA